MRPIKYLTLTLILGMTPTVVLAELATVTVHVRGALPPTGVLEISLFNSAETFMKEPWLQQQGQIDEDGNSTVSFAALPEGDYAVIVVHDANANNTYDNGFLGFGAERYGYTVNEDNLHWYRFMFGRPDFDETRFTVNGDVEVTVDLD
jgi:uncharacterized protein (DUF2141 family)